MTQLQSIEVIPRMLGSDFSVMDQLFSFAIFVINHGSEPVRVKGIGLMKKNLKKFPLTSSFLDGITGFPAVLAPQAQFRAIFHPEQDAKDIYVSAYIETEDGTTIEGKSCDLTLLSEG